MVAWIVGKAPGRESLDGLGLEGGSDESMMTGLDVDQRVDMAKKGEERG